jgi:hypothetical protein
MARVIALFRHHPTPSAAWRAQQLWRKLIAALREPYRPERHYMRGPGPKWREKHRRGA